MSSAQATAREREAIKEVREVSAMGRVLIGLAVKIVRICRKGCKKTGQGLSTLLGRRLLESVLRLGCKAICGRVQPSNRYARAWQRAR